MGPIPDDSLGCIFTEKPRNLSNCSVGAPEWAPPARGQLVSGPRPDGALEQSLPGAEREKPRPALSRQLPAICRVRVELKLTAIYLPQHRKLQGGIVSLNKKPGLTEAHLGLWKKLLGFFFLLLLPNKYWSEPRKVKCLQHHVFPGGHPSKY